MTRDEVTKEILRITPPGRVDINILRAKTLQELNNILVQAQIDESIRTVEQQRQDAYERDLQRNAEVAAQDAIYWMNQAKLAEPKDRATLAAAAKQSELFGCSEANFSLVRQHCGKDFTAIQVIDAFQSGLLLAPPSQAELDQWHAEKQQEQQQRDADEVERLAPIVTDAMRNWSEDKYGRNQMLQKVRALPLDNLRERVRIIEENRRLASLSTEDLKKHSAGQRVEQRAQHVQQSFSNHRPLPADVTQQAIIKADTNRLRDLIRLYGSKQITARLRGDTGESK